MYKAKVFEIEYSASPGGKDTWAVDVENFSYYQEGFNSAGEAVDFLVAKYPTVELEIEVKSLAWFHAQPA